MYNMEKYIETCITSIHNQHLKTEEYEIIIIDDGSTDSSLELCRTMECANSNVTVFHQDNLGVGEARNKGIELSLGEWITFIDPDDYYFEGAFLNLLSYDFSNIQLLRFIKEMSRIILSSKTGVKVGRCFITGQDWIILLNTA